MIRMTAGPELRASSHFAIDEVPPGGPGSTLIAVGLLILSIVSFGLIPGARTTRVRVRYIPTGEIVIDYPFQLDSADAMHAYNAFTQRLRVELEELSPREFAAEHAVAWPPGPI